MGNDPRDKYMRQVLARNLAQKIKDSGQTQAQVARATEIGVNSLSSYLTANRYPRPEVLRKLADYFNVSVGDLTDDGTTRARVQGVLSNEASAVAERYDELDEYGKALVRMVLEAELRRAREGRETD